MSKVKNKQKGKLGHILTMLIFMIVGGICGYWGGLLIVRGDKEGKSLGESLLLIGCFLIFLLIGLYIQIIVHEGGHFIAGKMSGYKPVSFRIGKMMFVREKGKIQLKKFSIMGTGGQCLMMPPAYNEGNYPSRLYNLGGVLANVIFSTLCVGIYLILRRQSHISLFFFMIALVGVAIAIVNGVPMQIGSFANDGLNALSLSKDKEANKAFWLQLHINGVISQGTRFRDLPNEWFEFGEESDLTNLLVCTRGVLRVNYLLDKREFDEAKSLVEMLLEKATGLLGVHRNELCCALLFDEIMRGGEKEKIEELYTKEIKKYIKATSSYVSTRRLLYAYELLINKDEKAAKEQREAFEKVAKDYPYTAEIEAERELLAMIDAKKKP